MVEKLTKIDSENLQIENIDTQIITKSQLTQDKTDIQQKLTELTASVNDEIAEIDAKLALLG